VYVLAIFYYWGFCCEPISNILGVGLVAGILSQPNWFLN